MADAIRYGTTTDQEGKDRYFNRLSDVPPAAEFGPGLAIIKEGPTLKISDGVAWSPVGYVFTPSIYSGEKSATTNGASQVEAVPTGGKKIYALNNDATNSAYIGFGNSEAEAKANRDGGVAGETQFLVLSKSPMQQIINYSHYAWIGVGGTVSLQISIGV